MIKIKILVFLIILLVVSACNDKKTVLANTVVCKAENDDGENQKIETIEVTSNVPDMLDSEKEAKELMEESKQILESMGGITMEIGEKNKYGGRDVTYTLSLDKASDESISLFNSLFDLEIDKKNKNEIIKKIEDTGLTCE